MHQAIAKLEQSLESSKVGCVRPASTAKSQVFPAVNNTAYGHLVQQRSKLLGSPRRCMLLGKYFSQKRFRGDGEVNDSATEITG